MIAGGFSYGSHYENVNYYPVHECYVIIAVNPFGYRDPNVSLNNGSENAAANDIGAGTALLCVAASFAILVIFYLVNVVFKMFE